MADLSVVMDKLQGFENADDIAAFLQGYGIKAMPRQAQACAITMFIKEETGMTNIATGTKNVVVYDSEDSRSVNDIRITHTDAIEQFVLNYDQYKYPLLQVDS